MSATGIGASVRRKEDHRFITGKGHYTDDINRPGQAYAYFVRSPHAHATIKSIDVQEAAGMPGVVAVLNGAQLAADKIGNLICGWMIHSKDGSPMKMAAHPALANGKACHVGDPVAVVIADTLAQARDAAEKVKVDYAVLPAIIDLGAGATAGHPANPRSRAEQHDLSVAPRRPEGAEARIQIGEARHQARYRQQSAGPEPIEPRAALAEYDAGTGSAHALEHLAEPARRAPRHLRVCRHRAGTQIAGYRARRRRRLRLEDLHLSRRGRGVMGVQRCGRPVKWISDRSEAFLVDAHGRDHVTHAEMAFDADGKILGLRVKTIANIGAYMQTFSSAIPTYIYATLLSGQYADPANLLRGRCGLHQHQPVDAYRGAGRPEATFVVERLIEVGARELGWIRRSCGARTSSSVPASDAGRHCV